MGQGQLIGDVVMHGDEDLPGLDGVGEKALARIDPRCDSTTTVWLGRMFSRAASSGLIST